MGMALTLDEKIRRFMRVYSSIPLMEAELPICVIGGKPVSWKRAALEVEGNTSLSEKILDMLIEQGFI